MLDDLKQIASGNHYHSVHLV